MSQTQNCTPIYRARSPRRTARERGRPATGDCRERLTTPVIARRRSRARQTDARIDEACRNIDQKVHDQEGQRDDQHRADDGIEVLAQDHFDAVARQADTNRRGVRSRPRTALTPTHRRQVETILDLDHERARCRSGSHSFTDGGRRSSMSRSIGRGKWLISPGRHRDVRQAHPTKANKTGRSDILLAVLQVSMCRGDRFH